MLEEENRVSSSLKENFGKIVTFHKKYMVLHDLISDTITLYCKYWYEFIKAHPSIIYDHTRT